jgi:hypothetical protein
VQLLVGFGAAPLRYELLGSTQSRERLRHPIADLEEDVSRADEIASENRAFRVDPLRLDTALLDALA